MPQWLVIGISGVTCGGKTTLGHNLRDYLQNVVESQQLWNAPYILNDVQLISQDDYFLPVEDPRQKWNERLNVVNYELITSLDMKQMLHDITWIMRGRKPHKDVLDNIEYINEMAMSTNFEHYADHKQQKSRLPANRPYNNIHYQQQHQQQIVDGTSSSSSSTSAHVMRGSMAHLSSSPDYKINILLLDGFLLYNQPELLGLCHMKYHLHIPYEKCYARRRLRTYDPPDVTGYFEICVWPHYEKNLVEYRQHKDIKFLNGDLPEGRLLKYVLQRIKKYVEKRNEATGGCTLPPHKFLGNRHCHSNSQMKNSSSRKSSTLGHH